MQRITKALLLLLAYLFVLSAPLVGEALVGIVSNEAGTCHQLKSGVPISNGFGSSYSLFNPNSRVVLFGQCNSTRVAVQAGDLSVVTIIYKNGYRWDGTAWQQFNFSGTDMNESGTWLGPGARADVAFGNSDLLYVTAYFCESYQGSGGWKCGCHSQSQCSGNGTYYWNLQKYDRTKIVAGGGDDDDDIIGDDDDDIDDRPIVGVNGGPFVGSTVSKNEFEPMVGKPQRILLRFPGNSNPGDSWASSEGSLLSGIKSYITANPNDMVVFSYALIAGIEGANGAKLGECASGAFNNHYRLFAERAKNLGLSKLIIRVGWEFDGDGWPWGTNENVDKAVQYKNCWKQFVNTVEQTYPDNEFLYDWNFVYRTPRRVLDAAYPGNDYVDIISADIYDRCYASAAICNNPDRRWNEWHKPGLDQLKAFATDPAHTKPMSIPEWGLWASSDSPIGGDDNPRFIQGICEWAKDPSNSVVYYSYFNESRHRLQQFPNSRQAFSDYCNANQRNATEEIWD